MMDHAVQKIGDKGQDYWAISASIAPICLDKVEPNPFSSCSLAGLEEVLGARSSISAVRRNCLGVKEEYCAVRDSSSTTSDSGAYSGSESQYDGRGRTRLPGTAHPAESRWAGAGRQTMEEGQGGYVLAGEHLRPM